jgi:hypothetical protein
VLRPDGVSDFDALHSHKHDGRSSKTFDALAATVRTSAGFLPRCAKAPSQSCSRDRSTASSFPSTSKATSPGSIPR